MIASVLKVVFRLINEAGATVSRYTLPKPLLLSNRSHLLIAIPSTGTLVCDFDQPFICQVVFKLPI